jgi:hypothetical protein
MAEANSHGSVVRDVGGIAIRLLEDIYMAWSAAQLECDDAWYAWLDSGSPDHAANHYHAYLAALDREEAAAVHLERLSHLVAA